MNTVLRSARIVATACILASGLTVDTMAQESSLSDLLACDKIKNEADRLKCFNAVVEALKANPERQSTDLPATSSQPRTSSGEDVAARPSSVDDSFGKPPKVEKEAPQELIAEVTRFWRAANNRYVFQLANGQIWTETSRSFLRLPSDIKQVRIKKGAVGGYRIFIKGASKPGRVKRLH